MTRWQDVRYHPEFAPPQRVRLCILWCNMVRVRTWGQQPAHNLMNSTRGVTCGPCGLLSTCDEEANIAPQDADECNLFSRTSY